MTTKVAAQPVNLARTLSTYLNQSQDSAAAHTKLITKCQQLFKDSNFDQFFDTFTGIMQHVMITMQKNPHVDRIIDFIAKFATSLTTKAMDTTMTNGENKENGNQSTTLVGKSINHDSSSLTLMDHSAELGNPFLNALIDFLIETNRSNSDAVRYRCCQILSKLMASINDQFVDEDLFDRLCDAMLERLKDINSRVQVQAIAAIYRLQDPNDRDCRVIKALLFLMTFDPNWQVRYQALSHVAFSRATMPDIIDRVRDPHPTVRRKALLILSEKVLIKFISIEKRLFILNYALKDDDKLVVDTCCKKLLPSWLAFKENDLCKLLKALDVVDSTDTVELMLNKMYADESLDRLFAEFSALLNDKHVIPSDKLDAESALYWSWICSKCKSIASSSSSPNDHNNTVAQVDSDEYLDRLLPSLTEFCEYVTEILKKFEVERIEKANDPRHQVENSFIVKQLVKLFAYLDYSDVHGKKMVVNLCHEIFSNKNYTFLFDNVMNVYKMILPNLQQRINNLAELISDLQDPAPPNTQQQEKDNQMNGNEPTIIDTTVIQADSNEKTLTASEINLKISELKFKRFKLKDDFDNLYKEARNIDKQVDMQKLSELREEIKKCEDEITDLQTQLNAPKQNESPSKLLAKSTHEATATADSTSILQQQPFDPVERAFHCLQITVCLLQDLEVKSLTAQLRSLFDTLIIPNIGSVHEDIRKLAVRALNLTCILKLELAQKYVPLLLEIIQRDKKDVVIEAFKAMINCIMAFSTNRLINGCTDANNEIDPDLVAEATSKILSVMTSLLDHDDSDIYTVAVEGFCKLYMTGHILSAKLFSKLLIMYYSPLTLNDVKLRACLSSFLPQFSFLRASNQLCVEEAFMPTLKCLLNASSDSYISEIDLNKVIEVLYHLTNPKNLIQRKTVFNQVQKTANICHENIVKSICYEILKDDNAYKCKTYLKVLQMADLSGADYGSLNEILNLANDINEHIGDKILKKTSTKFYETILEQISKMPEYIQEQEKKKREMEESKVAEVSRMSVMSRAMPKVDEEDHNDSLSTSSNEMIDLEFKKLNKKAGLIKKMANTTNMSTMSHTSNQSRIFEKQAQTKHEVEEIEPTTTNGTIIPASESEKEEDEKEEEEENTVIEQETSRVTRNGAVTQKTAKITVENSESSDEDAMPKRKQQKTSDSPRKGRSASAVQNTSVAETKSPRHKGQAKAKQARSQSSIVDSRKETHDTLKRNNKRTSVKIQPTDSSPEAKMTRRSSSRLNISTKVADKDEPPTKIPRPIKAANSKQVQPKKKEEKSPEPARSARSRPNQVSPAKKMDILTKSRSLSKQQFAAQEKPTSRSSSVKQAQVARSSSRTATLRKSPRK